LFEKPNHKLEKNDKIDDAIDKAASIIGLENLFCIFNDMDEQYYLRL